MKKTTTIGLIFGITFGITFGVAEMLKQEKVIVEEITVTHSAPPKAVVPVEVTLTKYQLEKMVNLIEEKYADFNGRPAEAQDSMTFKATARGRAGIYHISSTQLARYTGKIRTESEEAR